MQVPLFKIQKVERKEKGAAFVTVILKKTSTYSLILYLVVFRYIHIYKCTNEEEERRFLSDNINPTGFPEYLKDLSSVYFHSR